MSRISCRTATHIFFRFSAFPVTEALDHGKHAVFINIVTAVLGAMFFIAAIIVVMIFKKLKREKIKKQLAIETARAVIVTHWTKKVVVEKPQMNGSSNTTEDGLVSDIDYPAYPIDFIFLSKQNLRLFICTHIYPQFTYE